MFDWNIMKCEGVAEKSGGREGYTLGRGIHSVPHSSDTQHTTWNPQRETQHTQYSTEITSESFPLRSRQPGCGTRQQMEKLDEKNKQRIEIESDITFSSRVWW